MIKGQRKRHAYLICSLSIWNDATSQCTAAPEDDEVILHVVWCFRQDTVCSVMSDWCDGCMCVFVCVCMQLESYPEVAVVVQLDLWDAGERTLQKFDHIRPACLSSTHGTLLVFSYQDRSVWPRDLERHISARLN